MGLSTSERVNFGQGSTWKNTAAATKATWRVGLLWSRVGVGGVLGTQESRDPTLVHCTLQTGTWKDGGCSGHLWCCTDHSPAAKGVGSWRVPRNPSWPKGTASPRLTPPGSSPQLMTGQWRTQSEKPFLASELPGGLAEASGCGAVEGWARQLRRAGGSGGVVPGLIHTETETNLVRL